MGERAKLALKGQPCQRSLPKLPWCCGQEGLPCRVPSPSGRAPCSSPGWGLYLFHCNLLSRGKPGGQKGFFQLLPLLETRCIERNNAFGIPYPTLEMDAPPTAQRKAKTKGKASPFPVPRPGTLPVVSQWFLNEFVPRSLPRESVCSPAFTL